MEERNLLVFVNVNLFLHEDGFTKLKELLKNSSEKLKLYSLITVNEGHLTVEPFDGNRMHPYTTELFLQLDYLLLSVKNLKILLSLDDEWLRFINHKPQKEPSLKLGSFAYLESS